MKFITAYFLVSSIFCNNGFSCPTDTIPANDSRIEYTGRIDFANPLAPKFSYSGVSIRVNFKGKAISAVIDDNLGQNYYNIILDDSIITVLKIEKGKRKYNIAVDLKDTIHEIEIFKRTEEMFGKTTFCGFVVDDCGYLVEINHKRSRLVEFIGNSITCGYGNEGIKGGKFSASTENHYLTYAAITSGILMRDTSPFANRVLEFTAIMTDLPQVIGIACQDIIPEYFCMIPYQFMTSD